MHAIDLARGIARDAHVGQKYGEKDYFEFHVMGVVISLMIKAKIQDPTTIIVALLHDVLEDTAVTKETLALHFDATVVEAVEAMTERKGESRKDYLVRVRANPTARLVKIHDALFNLTASVHDGQHWRIRRYTETLEAML